MCAGGFADAEHKRNDIPTHGRLTTPLKRRSKRPESVLASVLGDERDMTRHKSLLLYITGRKTIAFLGRSLPLRTYSGQVG
ncbi:hypothetical protein BAUCODRAFT_121829 [Baudoinia panamericana UAMH 10762]|uniref:Uncharacterized protein n=1 Tax=Baudoinia panamericana (strain UAMH 10762) TaxID=717646 RepID=M2LSC1_BAUPA|nr:uncharacterized protein BAUCODRAFT_121829 [Baudoinia panamericana UAMH 10762]EMC97372.1 hypothetical protein BAUCODRAFT_121829 [Baudoinia panamericana UAMH 10762]